MPRNGYARVQPGKTNSYQSVLIEAIKEQQKAIDELQDRVSAMQHLAAEIEGMKAQLAERGN